MFLLVLMSKNYTSLTLKQRKRIAIAFLFLNEFENIVRI
ncbi:hypothetical protein HCMG_01510 [Helicobacter canadensis MIT 98-5491]|nr:hypothetical protein HCMG_01510 [Helicobacter canadensis MIT 98-5491]